MAWRNRDYQTALLVGSYQLKVDRFLRAACAVPGLYPFLVFLTARRVVVRGPSMYPTIRPGDCILFDLLAYKINHPQPGDIVLARHPSRPGVRFIKRVATPPQPDEYWLLGDNPDASTDSRILGPFRREDIIARAWLIYWPRNRFGMLKLP